MKSTLLCQRPDVSVLERPDATYFLRIRGHEVTVLLVVSTRLCAHSDVVRRVIEALDEGARPVPENLPIERLPIPERL